MKVAVCGLGSAAQRAHLPALAEAAAAGKATVVGVCDPDPERRTQVATSLPEAAAYPDVVELLDGCAPDLLVIASPPSAHLAAIEAAGQRDVDVLCEKPLGIGSGDVDELGEIVARHPRLLLATMHQYHHAPAWRRLAGEVAPLIAAGRSLTLGVDVERPGTDPLSAGGWRARGDREGGILGDHAVHYLALCWLLDADCRVLDCSRTGEPGRETAQVALRLGTAATASIRVSYRGEARHNFIAAATPDGRLDVRWADGELSVASDGGGPEYQRVGALSDRQFVNDLYRDHYADLLARRGDPQWRRERVQETLGVAALLDACLGER
jgi:predicted dehydrogenase